MIRKVDRKNLALKEASLDPNAIFERHFYINHGSIITSMTVDNTSGGFRWHIGVMVANSPDPTTQWDNGIKMKALASARKLLHGLGKGKEDVQWGDYALHMRKDLSEREIEQLPPSIQSFIKQESDIVRN